MELSHARSYALAAVVYLARQKAGTPAASWVMAKADGTPERYLSKVLKPLVSARVLRSNRGPNGGYTLARPAKEITLLDVVEAVDGPIQAQVPEFEHEAPRCIGSWRPPAPRWRTGCARACGR